MYKQQFINEVKKQYQSGVSVQEISDQHGVGKSTIYGWLSKVPKNPQFMKRHSQEVIDQFCKRVYAGEKQIRVAQDLGISPATANTWLKKTKQEIVSGYSIAFKRNVIGSLQAGRSMYEVQKTYNITHTELTTWINEFKEGKYDPSVPVQHALKATVPEPAIATMSVAALDSVLDIIKTLTSKGLEFDTAVDVSKSLMHKLK